MDRRSFNRALLGAGLVAASPATLAEAVAAAARIDGDLDAATLAGNSVTLPKSAVRDFGASLRGRLLAPGNEGYDTARRVWNGMIDRHPALIARCAGAADVINSVDFARAHDLLVAVRGGGHSISGKSTCEGGLVIDLSPMRWVRIDPRARTARVGAGSLLGDLDRESQFFGLATPCGTVSHTGAAGLTLGGGHGRLSRRFGLTCDNVRAADLVIADGSLVRASADENPDLYWGIRGGGGNFGVVTEFVYDLHEVGPEILSGTLMYPLAQARDALKNYAAFAARAPREVSVDVVMITPPGRKTLLMFSVCCSGDFAAAEKALAPLREFGKPIANQLRPEAYTKLQTSADKGTPAGMLYYNKSGLMRELADDTIDNLVSMMETAAGQADPGVTTNALIQHLGGAVGDPAPGDTAYAHRDARHDFLVLSGWRDPAYTEQNVKWLRDAYAVMEANTIGFYSNHMVDSDTDKVNRTFRGNYERMVALKNKFDPANRFRLNANVEPTVS